MFRGLFSQSDVFIEHHLGFKPCIKHNAKHYSKCEEARNMSSDLWLYKSVEESIYIQEKRYMIKQNIYVNNSQLQDL